MLNEIDLSRVDLNLLVLFEVVFAEGHVGRAAERLHLSPSAVSHGLGRLRQLLNDPVFLKTPRGVVPTERAEALAPAITDLLARARGVIARAEPFDAATSTRRMMIGAPDGVSAVFLSSLLAHLRTAAPGIDIGIRQLLPVATEIAPARAWQTAFAELESRALDVAVIPSDEAPLRFEKRLLYEEDFVLAMHAGHAFRDERSEQAYCSSRHLVVSHSGDPFGFVDEVLAEHGLRRRVVATVPNFMFAAALLRDSDLVCALPRRFAERNAAQLGFVVEEPPLPLGRFRLNAFTSKAALKDDGVAWLLDCLAEASAPN